MWKLTWQNLNMVDMRAQKPILVTIAVLVVSLTISAGCKKKSPNFSFAIPTNNGDSLLWASPDETDADPSVKILWYAHYIGDAKVGHRRFVIHEVKQEDNALRRIASEDHLETFRFTQRNEQDLTQASLEKPDGTVHSFGYQLKSGKSTTKVEGVVAGNKVDVVRQDDQEAETTFAMGWPRRGPSIFGIESSLANKPMSPGETRDVRVYRPLHGVISKLRLTAQTQEQTEIDGEKRSLLRIESQQTSNADLSSAAVYWADEQGTIVKTEYPFMNRTMILVTKEKAESFNQGYAVDLGFGNVVETDLEFDAEKQPVVAIYKVMLESLPADKLFAEGPTQKLLQSGATTLLKVTTTNPNSGNLVDTSNDAPTIEDRNPNTLINSDDHRVKAFAEAVISNHSDPWKTATALENAVYSQLDKNEISQVFDPAGTVVKKRSGDCSEHAVLLAAACRHFDIPARVVVGLIHDQEKRGFLYHMWNEVWIEDRWIPLDGTVGKGQVGVDHIKFHHSSLTGQSPYDVVTPIVNVIGQLKIEVEGIEYASQAGR